LFFFVEDEENVEEEGFYKIISGSRIFYVFVTNLCEQPLDSEIGARFSDSDFSYDKSERFLLYAHASVLMEHRKNPGQNIIGYKTIPRHGDGVFPLEDADFDILKLPKLDFANVRSGSKMLNTTAGFRKKAYITHWLLSGWTNSGKTNSAKVLLGVTVKGDENGSFAGGVIIDPHGEYYRGHDKEVDGLKWFNTPNNPKVKHYTLDPSSSDKHEKQLRVSTQNIYPSHLMEVYDFREETQGAFMHYICNEKRGDWISFILNNSVEEIKNAVPMEKANEFVISAVKSRLSSIFQRDDQDVWTHDKSGFIADILDGVKRGNWYVVDVSSISDKATKVITAMISRKIFNSYKHAKIRNSTEWRSWKPAGILVEEAHNYLSTEEASKGNIIAKIAKEGRKFKVFSIIVEQDPSGIDSRILKQVHNKITLQLIPVDAESIVKTTPYIGDLEKKIPYYETGEGVFVSTGSFNFALPVKFPKMDDWMRNNAQECKKCKKGLTFDPSGVCEGCQKKQESKDVKAFM
jgi:hypothetical protein